MTTSPVPVWLYHEQQALRAYASFDTSKPAERDRARKLFHASFRRVT
jgi:hypothetical protein